MQLILTFVCNCMYWNFAMLIILQTLLYILEMPQGEHSRRAQCLEEEKS